MTFSWSVQADWIFPGDGSAIREGVMRGCGERIESVGAAGEVEVAANHERLERAVILPGLVNAHTHLELSHLRGKLPRGASMPRWIVSLLQHRGGSAEMLAAVEAGAAEALASGTTTVADICHDNRAWRVLADLPLRKLCLAEVVGRGMMERGAIARLEETLRNLPPEDDRLRFGISPHAPYSTSLAVYRAAVELADARGWPICTHLAEVEAEREFLADGAGLLAQWAAQLGFLPERPGAEGRGPMEFARQAGLLRPRGALPSHAAPLLREACTRPAAILAHVNYITDEELALLAQSDASVVYCPRSSAFFGRSGHPYRRMLERGINVAVGTDSLASNDSLDMFEELRALYRQGGLDNSTILAMGTIHGARALGWGDRIGSLAPGKFADWIALRVEPLEADPLEAILRQPCPVVRTVVGGRVARG